MAASMPLLRLMNRHEIAGQLAGGAGFAALGDNSAGAAADSESGIAGASSEDGTALGFAQPGGALAGAFGSGFFFAAATPGLA
ncbi:hypothetical protein FGB62_45g174 [Gracilaria domingensis]|nr:hypothetical protein FGB62_45g174 [Gracilaria domingensis]